MNHTKTTTPTGHAHTRYAVKSKTQGTTKIKLETPLRQDETVIHHRRREEPVTAMAEANMGCWNVNKNSSLRGALNTAKL
jgi:hypothetical protein